MLATADTRAQGPDSGAATAKVGAEDGRNSFTVVGTATFANGSIEGSAFDRHLFLAGIRYSRILVRRDILTLSYDPELLPGAWLSQPILGDDHRAVQRSIPPFTHTETAFGAGASPIALELAFLPARALQPLVGTDEGFLYFSRNVPSPLAARFNFTLAVRLCAFGWITERRCRSSTSIITCRTGTGQCRTREWTHRCCVLELSRSWADLEFRISGCRVPANQNPAP
jgi:hypothetical protein